MPKRRLSDGEFSEGDLIGGDLTGGEELSDVWQSYGNLRTRIPADARMSSNIEDRRGQSEGEVSIYDNKLSRQRTRGSRLADVPKDKTPRPPRTDLERDIDETAERYRKNASKAEPGMSPAEERLALEKGEHTLGYALEKKRREWTMDDIEAWRKEGVPIRPSSTEDTSQEYSKGGLVRKKSRHRGDGICVKGHTKGRMY